MGRSVSYLNNAEYVLYFLLNESGDESEAEDVQSFIWDDMISSLTCEIKAKLPSYFECDEWDNRETRIFLKNYLCVIGISEYCGLVSLSIAVRNQDYNDKDMSSFASYHAGRIRKTLEKIVTNVCGTRYVKQGTFSNGESVYQKV